MARQRCRFAGLRVVLSLLALGVTLGLGQVAEAQQAPPSTGSELVVTGIGTATMPATSAQIQVLLSSYSVDPLSAFDIGPLIDAIVATGVPEGAIEAMRSTTMMGPIGPGGGQIRFELSNPTASGMEKLVQAIYDGVAQIPGGALQIGHIGVRYLTDDCARLQEQAIAAAVADGWERAERLAAALNTNLGELTRAEESLYGSPDAGSCRTEIPGFMGGMYGPGVEDPYDPNLPVEAAAYATVLMTFAAGPAAAATPES